MGDRQTHWNEAYKARGDAVGYVEMGLFGELVLDNFRLFLNAETCRMCGKLASIPSSCPAVRRAGAGRWMPGDRQTALC